MSAFNFHILVVDDTTANRYTMKAILGGLEHVVILEANSGEQALALTIEQQVDLILLDIQMPGMDGFETAHLLKMSASTRDIPIIFITAIYRSEHFYKQGYQVGAVDYLTKPVDENLLLNRILSYMRLLQREKSLQRTMAELQRKEHALQTAHDEIAETLRERTVALDRASDAIISADQQGHVIFWNHGAERIFGYPKQTILHTPLLRLIPDQLHETFLSHFSEVIASGEIKNSDSIYEFSGLRANGEVFPIEVSVSYWQGAERHFFSAVVRDISQRKQLETQLRHAQQISESANRAKSTFLATMSHEIRTPLNTILGMGQLLEETDLTEMQHWCVNILGNSGRALLTLINDILDLSKIEEGHLSLEHTPFDLHQLLQEVEELFTFSALAKGITLRGHFSESLPQWVMGDPTRLRQVLLNLLGNAIKFTKQGFVELSAQTMAEDEICFSVFDSGPGIAKERQQEIFLPFTQADSSTTRKYGGSGLGLTISRRLVKLMHGQIQLESRLGKGSRFYFSLNLPQAPTERIPPPSLPATTVVHSSPQRALTILVADDSDDNRILIEAFLKKSPYKLVMASNGLEALEEFKKQPFDLVLTDIQMPIMDGYEAIRQIRQWESSQKMTTRTPIIALTAHVMKEEAEQIEQAGGDLHLSKPIQKKRLLEVIQTLTHDNRLSVR
ncbi:PAS/PAC sensor hybrid histidine kinase [Magnetococcus marinus MC-1]|uniref:Sensory/regulatory protein RpfC n=1 Tax=Magnetococcus marinus (strain ATCC BAA-1437 / JCM 17883 / MC-1) TaxID=156889 RepID=A0L9H2_MAGMM|nr:response regulator [Magnetococcus marinus]ABK44615.1 PAS/PAC sensor hybrid histidine kinase [Magnetococcus marinus MC-1]